MSSTPSRSPDAPRGDPTESHPRLSWQESLILVSALVFAGFLWVRGVQLQTALAAAISTVGALVLLLVAPRGTAEIIKLLREVLRRLGGGSR